jgi:hypothetical protein
VRLVRSGGVEDFALDCEATNERNED